MKTLPIRIPGPRRRLGGRPAGRSIARGRPRAGADDPPTVLRRHRRTRRAKNRPATIRPSTRSSPNRRNRDPQNRSPRSRRSQNPSRPRPNRNRPSHSQLNPSPRNRSPNPRSRNPRNPSRRAEPAEPVAPGQPLVNPQPGFLANVAVDHADGQYRQGEKLKVRFKVERDAHVYLLYHQADDTTVLLFPNQAHPSNLLKANEEVAIPGPGEPFRFRVSPPFGTEALQVVASTEPVAELDALDTAGGRAPQVSAELLKTLSERIAKDAGRLRRASGDDQDSKARQSPLEPARPAEALPWSSG